MGWVVSRHVSSALRAHLTRPSCHEPCITWTLVQYILWLQYQCSSQISWNHPQHQFQFPVVWQSLYSMENFKMIWQLRNKLWEDEISDDFSLRWVSVRYPILSPTQAPKINKHEYDKCIFSALRYITVKILGRNKHKVIVYFDTRWQCYVKWYDLPCIILSLKSILLYVALVLVHFKNMYSHT